MKKLLNVDIKTGRFIKGHMPTNGFKKGCIPIKPFKKGNIPWNKSDKISKTCRICKNIFYVSKSRILTAKFCSKKCLGLFNRTHKHSKNIIDNIRKSRIGKVLSIEIKQKMSVAAKLRWDNDLYRNKFSKENHFNWKGGISFEEYSEKWTKKLKEYIRIRDNYICYICNKRQSSYTFSVHHIDYNKRNCNYDNLITLCRECHIKTNYKRDTWIEYFKDIFSYGNVSN